MFWDDFMWKSKITLVTRWFLSGLNVLCWSSTGSSFKGLLLWILAVGLVDVAFDEHNGLSFSRSDFVLVVVTLTAEYDDSTASILRWVSSNINFIWYSNSSNVVTATLVDVVVPTKSCCVCRESVVRLWNACSSVIVEGGRSQLLFIWGECSGTSTDKLMNKDGNSAMMASSSYLYNIDTLICTDSAQPPNILNVFDNIHFKRLQSNTMGGSKWLKQE